MNKLRLLTLFAAGLLTMGTACGCGGDDDEPEPTPTPTPTPEPDPEPEPDPTPAEHDATQLVAKLSGQAGVYWAAGSTANIFCLESMLRNEYTLTDGEGTDSATMTRTKETLDFEGISNVYAVSGNTNIYGISATDEGIARLTAELPVAYRASQVAGNASKVPLVAPYWGMVSYGFDGKLHTTMSPLTSLLAISLSKIPADARAIVLCTHDGAELGNSVLPGAGEPLSGTFTCVLTGDAWLAVDERLRNSDTLRVNLNREEIRSEATHIYIPLLKASYKSIHTIAVTGDNRYPYVWEGTEL